MSNSTNINRLETIYNGLRVDTTNLAPIRSTKKTIHNIIHSALNNTSTISDSTYFLYKNQKTQLDQGQSITTYPQELGRDWDLTTFTDPGDGFEYYPYMFGKTLRHNATTGFVRKDDVDSILNIIKYNDTEALSGITYDTGSIRNLEGIFCSNGVMNEGAQIFTIGISNIVGSIDSKPQMFEMFEVYAKSLTRDQPFISTIWERKETLTGTAIPTASTTLTGLGTQFLTDESNGLLAVGDAIEVDGQVREVASITNETTLTVTKAFEIGSSSTIKNISRKTLSGSIDTTVSTIVTGVSTAFLTEVAIGDLIVVSGQTRLVVGISSNDTLTVSSNFSNNPNDTSPKVLPLVGNLVRDLNKYNINSSNTLITAPQYKGAITNKLLFRGNFEDEEYGPYISQLLIKPFRYGNMTLNQKFHPDNDPAIADRALNSTDWLEQQRGIKVFNASLTDTNTEKYCYNPRILGSIVHNDPLFQCYYDAALILNSYGIGTTGLPTEYHTSTWIDGGPPSVLGMIAEVANASLRVAWYCKYGLGMKIRPEVFAQRITFASNTSNTAYLTGGANPVSKLSNIKTNAEYAPELLTKIHDRNVSLGGATLSGKNYYLYGQYEEGSPTHPSFPAGHAVVGGACVTVIKAMIITRVSGTDAKIAWVAGGRTAQQPDITGDNLVSYVESDASSMTIIGELNKLASNIALGRDFASVHYRQDGDEGNKIGEAFAITFLQDKIKEFGSYVNGTFTHFDLTKFDGSRIHIYADRIVDI